MANANAVILVVEDDPPIQRFLRAALDANGYRVIDAATCAKALMLFNQMAPDAVILDLGMPDCDGIEIVRHIRKLAGTPILIVSARGHERGKIEALDAGADDYLTKPFGIGELLARLRVALRRPIRTDGPGGGMVTVGDITVNLDSREVTVAGQPVHLTPHEYRLLMVLLSNAGKVLTHKQLLKEVWGAGYGFETHYVRIYMNQLRKKIEPDPSQPRYIHTEIGVGYRLNAED